MATAAAPVGVSAPRSTSILSPVVDFLMVGGLSIIVFIPLLLTKGSITWVTVGTLAWIHIFINYAHFMGSYRIVYRSKEMIFRHKWATIGVPLIMLGFLIYALTELQTGSMFTLALFFMVASGYLAWHYTGQTWGMMVSFAHLNGIRHDRTEYWLIRGGLRILLVWHLVWFLRLTLRDPSAVNAIFGFVSWLTVAAFFMGIVGFIHLHRRTGKAPPFRYLVAWFAIFVWYMIIAKFDLVGLFLVQLAHAIQYLEFPFRVEINRAAAQHIRSRAAQLGMYIGGMALLTLVLAYFLPNPSRPVVPMALGGGAGNIMPVLLSYFIAIHHFFTDGVIWKLRNPDVQADLFAHARPTAATSPVPPMWWQKGFWIRG